MLDSVQKAYNCTNMELKQLLNLVFKQLVYRAYNCTNMELKRRKARLSRNATKWLIIAPIWN